MSRVPRKIHFIAAGLFMATNLLAAGIILQAEVCHHLEGAEKLSAKIDSL